MNIFETKELCHDSMDKAHVGFAGTTKQLKNKPQVCEKYLEVWNR